MRDDAAAGTGAGVLPVVPVRARGLTIEGADGRRYLDCVSGAGTLPLGHNHPVALRAIREVLDAGAPLQVAGLTTPVEEAFVAELMRTLPPGLADRARVRFCDPAGKNPVATAAGLVRAATGRTRVIHSTDADADVDPDHAAGTGLAAPRPEEALPAGMLLEPVRSRDGVLPTPDAVLRRLRRGTAERSVPLIVDETETGVGRTGAFWAVEHSGVVPDVLVLSKAIGGGLPLAAVVYRDDLHTGEGSAFRGNQLAMAAGAATLAHVREHRLAEHAAALGGRTLARLRGLAEDSPCVGDVRGLGLMIGIELTAPDGTADAAPRGTRLSTAAAVQRECLRRGLIVDLAGPSGNVVRLLPPLIVTEEQMSAVLDRLADAVQAVERGPSGHVPSHGVRAAHRP
ncbi:aminotransferase class III-fold pyridoxal phosphate-dependent enzyme [Streptomyces sp. NPDC057376]|uniref:aminotransferase class III-fold pyridoxal phosphate-dependent enzyme n=1 Tax=unclassified Streptomyces TaxID=2593676 RepID=UPI000938C83C|nr:aminotransferase class III-fold pyridoxal phosphate-dependent enzyme [Streptomyces sp. CB02414]OKI76918.1 diaminobutyrate--2-oxoglutarate aminotransferase [Streptomyces sp. CB02414]